MSGDVGMRYENSAAVSRDSIGQPLASGTKPPDPSWVFLWMPGSSSLIPVVEDPQRVLWCSVGQHERTKCDEWSAVSGDALECTTEETTEDCIAAIVVSRAPLHS